MAIAENSSIDFFGTQNNVDSSSSSVTDGSFSVTADITSWTNDDDARRASATLTGTFASTADANSAVLLFARLMNTDGTNDNRTPSANHLHTLLGAFPIDATTTQTCTIDIPLPNAYTSQAYEFYIQNKAGQTLNSGWTLDITPKADGPHPA